MNQPLGRNAFTQAALILLVSSVIGVGANLIRPQSVPWASQPAFEIPPHVPVERGHKLLSNGESLFVDARPVEFFQHGRILNAVSLPLKSPEASVRQAIPIPHPYKHLVVYCEDETCGAADAMARRLKRLGYDKIMVLEGGWRAWTEAKLPTE